MSDSFTDIHCHMLPAIDDGATDWDVSMAMARMAVRDGFSTVVATPHQLGNFADNSGDQIRRLVSEFQQRLNADQIPLTILPGADVRIEPDLIHLLRSGQVLTLGDLGRYVLLELPHELYFPLDPLLDQLRAAGLIGILSHPERNQGILRSPNLIEPLVEAGCLMQVTAGSLMGSFGPKIAQFSEWMVTQGFVHFLATDAHGVKSRRPLMGGAFERIVSLVGEDPAWELCCDNPAKIVADEVVLPGRRQFRRTGLLARFWQRRAG